GGEARQVVLGVSVRVLRVPLDSHHPGMGVFDALDDTVERPRHGTESLARFVDRLMVSGTDGRVGLAEPCGDPGVRGQPDLLVEEHALPVAMQLGVLDVGDEGDRKSTRLNSSHVKSSYAVFCLKKKTLYKE